MLGARFNVGSVLAQYLKLIIPQNTRVTRVAGGTGVCRASQSAQCVCRVWSRSRGGCVRCCPVLCHASRLLSVLCESSRLSRAGCVSFRGAGGVTEAD